MKKLIVLFLVISSGLKAQVYVQLAPGITNTKPSLELQVGGRVQQLTFSAGYIAMPSPTQPSLFNVRAGILYERFHLYAGAVRVLQSTDYKERNYYTAQVGIGYHFMYYEKTTFYTSFIYTPGFPTVNIGMSYRLFKE